MPKLVRPKVLAPAAPTSKAPTTTKARPAGAGKAAADPLAGKHAYEARRAAKAGVSLDRWLAGKEKRAQAERDAQAQAAQAQAAQKRQAVKPGLLKRLLDRAHKPI